MIRQIWQERLRRSEWDMVLDGVFSVLLYVAGFFSRFLRDCCAQILATRATTRLGLGGAREIRLGSAREIRLGSDNVE
jgi:uncharacterized membrane protein HdeD (DUF308 family)